MTNPLLSENEPSQLELAMRDDEKLRKARQRRVDTSKRAARGVELTMERGNPKEVADLLEVDLSQLYHWISGKGGRRLPLDLFLVVADLDTTGDLLAAVCELLGYDRPKKRVMRDPTQLVDAYRNVLQRFGPAGVAAIKEVEG